MKKIKLEYQLSGMTNFTKLFNSILEKSNFNLNQFVKGDSLEVTEDTPEQLLEELKEMIEMAPVLIRQIDDREKFWIEFEQLDDYDNNDKFVKWLSRYIEATLRPYEDALFLNKLDHDCFLQMTEYCFSNLIIKNIGKRSIDQYWNEKQMFILRKIMMTFIEMVVIDNYSKENVMDNMQRIFGIKNDYCDIWWKLVEKNEEKLWRIMLGKQISRMENKINGILDILEK